MNKHIAIALILLVLAASFIVTNQPVKAAGDYWVSKAPMPTGRLSCAAAVLDEKIYVIGGSSNITIVGTNEQYDPVTDEWTEKAAMPTPRTTLAVAACDGKIYAFGGYDENVGSSTRYMNYGVNEAYNPATNTWENKTAMPTPRTGLSANMVNGKIYLIAGATIKDTVGGTRFEIKAVNEVYDPATDSWASLKPIPFPVYYYSSAILNKKIYIIGGDTEQGGSNLNQIYDPTTDTWSQGTPLPSSRTSDAAAATTGTLAPERIYVFGNQFDADPRSNINQVYDPTAATWTTATPMPTARGALASAVVNDTIYAIGGGLTYAKNEQYTPIGYGSAVTSSSSPLSSSTTSPSQSPAPSITPTPTVPEFQSWIIVPLIFAGSIVFFVLKKRWKR